MNEAFKVILSDKITRWAISISVLLLLAQVIYLGIFYFSLPPVLPVYNQLPWGQARLGSRFEIFFPFVLALLFLLINFYLINKFYEKMPLLSRILSITVLLLAMLSFIFTAQTVQLVI